MLDNSFIYKKDFDQYYKKFQNQAQTDLYKSLYQVARLIESEDTKSLDFNEFITSYNKNLKLITDLVKDNYRLQYRVHELGIKNRLKKKVGRYRPPEEIKNYVTESELENILAGVYENSSYSSLLTFGEDALAIFKNLSDENFESGINAIQKQISLPKIKNPPLVSIIIPTRDGIDHLKRLFSEFDQSSGYSNYEIIVVDNASNDGTRNYLENLKKSLNLRIIYNSENKSFSECNNIAVNREAKGDYVLFLNNDVSPTNGWLNHMVSTVVKDDSVGAVGAKLIYPYKDGFENSFKIQHGGLGFKIENDFIRPVNMGVGSRFFSRNTIKEEEKAGVTAACLLISKKKFQEVGGFDEAYWYGYEDVDLCLKLREAGYKNIINNAAVLFHYEFGTQKKNKEKTIIGYRKNNMQVFKDKWQNKLYPNIWQDLLGDSEIFTDKKLHVAFIVTEANSKTAAGDYFTAKELGVALENKGFKVSYFGIRNTPNPYDIDTDVDALISMIDGYDISQITTNKPVKIAWCRNWFERWAERDYFRDFDIVLTNSERAQKLYQDKFFIDSYIFKIATNKDRFSKDYTQEELEEYNSDICFTGNYWHVPRDISKLFDVKKFKDRFDIKIFGKDWNHVKNLKQFWQGFIEYKNIPKVYAAGKVLIDDATFVVNEWGSVNSRVFDGAASGVLVLTNGGEGSKNTFDGIIPTFESRDELSTLLEKYLTDDKLRNEKIKEIQQYTLSHHTYKHRADQLVDILKKELSNKIINIKLPIPNWGEAKQWGDLHFGRGLKRGLESKGFTVKLWALPDWQKHNFGFANIVLRGLSVFELPKYQLNVMWNISHPEKVPLREYEEYDYVLVASKLHANSLKKKGLKNIYELNQYFDESVFSPSHPQHSDKYKSDVLFVGNTRNKYRKIVKDVMSWPEINKYNLKVYGKGWEQYIPKKFIGGEHIDNSQLKYYYQNTKILLNDHWDDMNKYGFVSNRLFDASACGTFVISDSNPGIVDIFGKNVIEEYSNNTSLHTLLNEYIDDASARKSHSNIAKSIVWEKHKLKDITEEIIAVVKELDR